MAFIDSPVQSNTIFVAKISEEIESWEKLAPYFGLKPAEEEEIRHSHVQYLVQKRKMLQRWVEKQGNRATYRELKRVFEEAGNSLLACKVDELLEDTGSQAPHNVVNFFRRYLKNCYCCKPAATYQAQKDWPLQLSQSSFLKPNLVLKSQQNSMTTSKSFEIEDLCNLDKNVVLEGTAGSGKTTLTRHICQQWAEGKLFHDVDLLIHLTLADPALWSAKSLEDMIPDPSAEIRRTVAHHIVERQGRKCCFILDGLEDLPERSFVHKVVGGKLPEIPHCLFIVTSRPAATASILQVSTTVEITGFSNEGVNTYATQCLTQEGRDPTDFITALNDNHYARGLCSLPINAVILLHLFVTIQTGFPTTQTELFKCFILNLLLRHLEANLGRKFKRLCEFSDLPPNEKQAFNNLCLIAHQSTFSGKASSRSNQLLSSDDLHEANDTLGLMMVHQQLTWFGYDPHYGFLHSSVQDFLCAVRMSQLGPEEQVRDFSQLLHSNPTSLVLRFYAGLTKLWNKYVSELLCDIGRNPPGFDCIHQVYAAQCAGGDPRRRFLTYLHCLYEANISHVLVKPGSVSVLYNFFRLTIHDLNVISYYILSIARISHPTCTELSFHSCFIDDHGVEALVATIIKQAPSQHSHQSGYLDLAIGSCTYTHRGVRALASLITLNSIPLARLCIQCSDFSSLKILIEAFSSPTAVYCRTLELVGSDLTSRHAYHLILLLTQARYLLNLNVSLNPKLHKAVPHLLSAARTLKIARFIDIPINNQELLEMAHVLQSNTSLTELNIKSSVTNYSNESLTQFVEIVTAPESKSRLEKLVFGRLEENKDMASLSLNLTRMADSRGHKLEACFLDTQFSELLSSALEQTSKASRMPDSLLYGEV